MREFTMDDLHRIITSCGGVDDAADISEDVADTQFAELGYDSLAILELARRVQQEYSLPIPDDALQDMTTPRSAVTYICERLTSAGV